MGHIEEIINQAIKIGHISPEAEQKLQQHLATQPDPQDLFAFMLLQHALISGRIRQTCQHLCPTSVTKPKNHTSQ